MSTYEHTTSVTTHGLLGRTDEELNRDQFERELNRMRTEAWELVEATTGMALHREENGHLPLFTRHPS